MLDKKYGKCLSHIAYGKILAKNFQKWQYFWPYQFFIAKWQ